MERKEESPSMRREWIEMFQGHELDKEHLGLPPCGGSGLKFNKVNGSKIFKLVSLHAEGVD